MKCPKCGKKMKPHSVVADNPSKLITTHLCTGCFHRSQSDSPNPNFTPLLPEERDRVRRKSVESDQDTL